MLLEADSSAMAHRNRASASWYSSAGTSKAGASGGLAACEMLDAARSAHPEHVVALDAPDQPR